MALQLKMLESFLTVFLLLGVWYQTKLCTTGLYIVFCFLKRKKELIGVIQEGCVIPVTQYVAKDSFRAILRERRFDKSTHLN